MASLTLSMVMPNYNHGSCIGRAFDAVERQSRPPDEFIILDDASTDDSIQVIESFARGRSFVRVERNERNGGVVAALKKLTEMAASEYIYFGAADDYISPGFFESAMSMAALHPEAGLLFGDVHFVDPGGKRVDLCKSSFWKAPLFADGTQFLNDYLRREKPMICASAATIFKRSALEETGGYRPELGSWSDMFAIRAVGVKYGACYIPKPFASFTLSAGSLSGTEFTDPGRILSVIKKFAALLRTPQFKEYFPADYADDWERLCRAAVVSDYVDRAQSLHDAAEAASRYGTSLGTAGERLMGKFFAKLSGLQWKIRRRLISQVLSSLHGD
jgi:glycosyltransferase involved in cell wall biosynthesis